jgi:hypothetical protein
MEQNKQLTTADHYTKRQFELMATKCGTNAESLQLIVNAESQRINELFKANETTTRSALQQIIFGVAEAYTTARLTNENGITEAGRIVLSECIKLVLRKFKFLSVPEIQEAFQQAAAGEIDADLNTYGKFNVSLFGNVLKAYTKRRNEIRQTLNANLLLIQSRKDDEQKEEKNQQAINDVLFAYDELRQRVISGEELTPDDIPVHYGKILADNDVLNVSDTMKAEIYKRAKKQAIFELKSGIKDTKKTGFQRNALKKQLKTVLDAIAGDVEEIRNAAVRIYKKLVVLESIENDIN